MKIRKGNKVKLQDISSEHMALLLEYMYRGCISVKQEDLQDILKSASTLQIRGDQPVQLSLRFAFK